MADGCTRARPPKPARAMVAEMGAANGLELRDLRVGGVWSPLQRAKNDVLYRLAIAALAFARLLPLPLLRTAGRSLGAAGHLTLRGPRATALANVTRVFPAMPEGDRRALVRRAFVTMGELLADAVALLRPADRGGPLLEVTPAARAVIEAARREDDPRFSRLYERLRGARGVRIVWRSSARGTRDARAVVRALRAGRVLGVPMDLRSRVASCDAPFLGHIAPTPVGPARIALRTGAAVVVGTAAPAGRGEGSGRHESGLAGSPLVITATRIRTDDLARDGAAAVELTARINRELSARIEALPHAWVWMHERW
jgi:lauroyl/myristoyl acyltransferase